jgi:cell fate regulator YaaT (PSP1 superfamily)
MATDSAAVLPANSEVSLYFVRCGHRPVIYCVDSGLTPLKRGSQLLVRTDRGLEMGEVLGEAATRELPQFPSARFVRPSQPEDQLLWSKLVGLSQDANDACQSFLREHQLEDVLLETEPLLDGRTIFFHFLGEPSPLAEEYVQTLASVYHDNVTKSKFAELLEKGCGPGCGTKEKAGCGTGGGCAVCAIAGGCTSKKRSP